MSPLRRLAALVLALIVSFAAPTLAGVAGTVLDTEQKPVANVAVLLVEPGDAPDIINGRLENLYGAELASTDDAGRFSFAVMPAGIYRLIAIGESGYGESDVGRAGGAVPGLTIQPWATIEGVAAVGGSTGAGANITGHCVEPLAEN